MINQLSDEGEVQLPNSEDNFSYTANDGILNRNVLYLSIDYYFLRSVPVFVTYEA